MTVGFCISPERATSGCYLSSDGRAAKDRDESGVASLRAFRAPLIKRVAGTRGRSIKRRGEEARTVKEEGTLGFRVRVAP